MPGCYAAFHKQLGDVVLLQPALARLQEHHGSPVMLMTRKGHQSLTQLMPGVEFQSGLPLARKSHLYCFDPLHKSAWRSLLAPAGVKQCILPNRSEMSWFHRPFFANVIVPELGQEFVAEYFWKNTPVPASSPFRPPELISPPPDWKPGGPFETPFALLCPTAGWQRKSWLPERWIEVMRPLADRFGFHFVMTSGPARWQVDHCHQITERGGAMVRSLANATSLREYLWLCANAEIVLTVDGSASHLAQAFGTRSVTLFGVTNIHNWHHATPRNTALQGRASKKDGLGRMRNIQVNPVLEAATALLEAAPLPR